MKSKIVPFLLLVFSLLAALVCYNLVLTHVTGTSGRAWFDAGCSTEAGATFSCAAVLQSPYSSFPPKFPDEPPGRWHVPVAFLGLLYYTSLAVWFLGIGAPSRDRAWLHAIVTIVVGVGLLGSAYYLWIMAAKIDAWCPWCLITHALNLLIGIGVVLLWPAVLRRPWSTGSTTDAEKDRREQASRSTVVLALDGATAQPVALLPSARVILMTFVAILSVNFGLSNLLGLKSWSAKARGYEAQLGMCKKEIDNIRNDPVLLATHWERTPEKQIIIQPEDPTRLYKAGETDQPPLNVVVFSDFECPSCNNFARFFEAQVVPLFDWHVQVTFKHYPIDQSCNPKASLTLHPHACEAAKMAEAARMLGGNDVFWKAHDYLFNHRDELARGQISPQRFAGELGLDPQTLVRTLTSNEIADHIAADAAEASRLGLTGTPGVFVIGKPVSQLAKAQLGFWDTLADMYFNGIGVPRPESTRPAKP